MTNQNRIGEIKKNNKDQNDRKRKRSTWQKATQNTVTRNKEKQKD
jgi:hypothetical protein